jgi:hypothetical protein
MIRNELLIPARKVKNHSIFSRWFSWKTVFS